MITEVKPILDMSLDQTVNGINFYRLFIRPPIFDGPIAYWKRAYLQFKCVTCGKKDSLSCEIMTEGDEDNQEAVDLLLGCINRPIESYGPFCPCPVEDPSMRKDLGPAPKYQWYGDEDGDNDDDE